MNLKNLIKSCFLLWKDKRTSHKYLRSTTLINYKHPSILALRDKILEQSNQKTPTEYAILTFNYVRDLIPYQVTAEYSTPRYLKASETVKRGYGHCVAKAIVFMTLLRAYNIPCRLHFVDLKNHRLNKKWVLKWGNKLLWHGYVELFLQESWISANPAFDKALCHRNQYILVEFDGTHDALFSKYDLNGALFMEYIKDHGVFEKVPYLHMAIVWLWHYGPMMFQNRHGKKNSLFI